MKASQCLLVVLFMATGCAKVDDHFWYPVSLKTAICLSFKGDVYVMTNSVGWRSWVYTLDPKENIELELPATCVFKVIRAMPEYKANRKQNIREQLNDEQRAHIVEGF